MYKKCLTCPKIGQSCDGPAFVAMAAPELLQWCKERKAVMQLTNAQLAELSGMPKGTIDRLLAGEHRDVRYETIRPLLRALVDGEWSGNPCPTASEPVQEPVPENELQWRDDKIAHLLAENARLTTVAKENREQRAKELEFTRAEMQRKNRANVILSVIMGLALLYIVVTLIIDRVDPERGLFWLESMLRMPQGGAGRIIGHL